MKPRALDLFCCAGGATKGLQRAGFHVTGIDIKPQPRYCGDAFIQGDATNPPVDLRAFSFVWASPPCQEYSQSTKTWKAEGREYPDLIGTVRQWLERAGLPWCIENVETAPLRDPVLFCGPVFGLSVYRHRIFEANFYIGKMIHSPHVVPQAKMGRPPKPGEFVQPVVQPAYSEFIGKKALEAMERAA